MIARSIENSLTKEGTMTTLSGVVVVSGAASGIGRASAAHFAECGAIVIAADLNAAGLATLATDRSNVVVGDLTIVSDLSGVAMAADYLGHYNGVRICTGLELID